MNNKYIIKKYPKFEKEFKKLSRKCPSLDDDFDKFQKVLQIDLKRGQQYLSQSRYHQIPNLGHDVIFPVFKLKKFRCASIKKGNRSPFRFIFILSREHNIIYFTECYFKGKKENHDSDRIVDICKNYEYYFEL